MIGAIYSAAIDVLRHERVCQERLKTATVKFILDTQYINKSPLLTKFELSLKHSIDRL